MSKPKRIICQNSNCGSREAPSSGIWANRGCSTCGGYGYIYQQFELSCCKRKTWLRPDPITVYHGKKLQTLDGLILIYRIDAPVVCNDCYEVKGKKVVKRRIFRITKVDKRKREIILEVEDE